MNEPTGTDAREPFVTDLGANLDIIATVVQQAESILQKWCNGKYGPTEAQPQPQAAKPDLPDTPTKDTVNDNVYGIGYRLLEAIGLAKCLLAAMDLETNSDAVFGLQILIDKLNSVHDDLEQAYLDLPDGTMPRKRQSSAGSAVTQ